MRRVKLRDVIAWMALVLLAASTLLCLVWKKHAYVRLSRALYVGEKEAARLQSGVMFLETEVRSLRQPSRLESIGRGRFGLIDPGRPVIVRLERTLAVPAPEPGEGMRGDSARIEAARWRGGFAWRTSGW